MYPEFALIYILLFVCIALLLVLIVLAARILSKIGRTQAAKPAPAAQAPYAQGNVVFCKNCAAQFDASQRYCPKCGTPRY